MAESTYENHQEADAKLIQLLQSLSSSKDLEIKETMIQLLESLSSSKDLEMKETIMTLRNQMEQKLTMQKCINGEQQAGSNKMSKKQAAKLRRKQEKQKLKSVSNSDLPADNIGDPLSANYGDVAFHELQSKAISRLKLTEFCNLDAEIIRPGELVHIRGRLNRVKCMSRFTFLVVRDKGCTVQCILEVIPGRVSEQMVKYVASLTTESIIDVEGLVSVRDAAITGTTQKVEIRVSGIYCISRSSSELPFDRRSADQDTRLNYRFFDLRSLTNQSIIKIQSRIAVGFQNFMISKGLELIPTPKILSGSSEGGSAVFNLDYMGQSACLAQSPQLHKQMAICGDMEGAFIVGAVFRAEKSNTHRHLCEFTGLDVEFKIKENYSEGMDMVDELFVSLFDEINISCRKELENIRMQYPFKPLEYSRKTPRLTFKQGIEMLKEVGVEVDPLGELNTENERKLGELVKEKYGTDFYILYEYPLAIRPFYTMPCLDNPNYSNSFDVFLRGEEIISGGQRINEIHLLEKRVVEQGIDVNTISDYLEAFRYGVHPHCGFGAGLERVTMLFLGLDNIRKTSVFPRDPKRLTP